MDIMRPMKFGFQIHSSNKITALKRSTHTRPKTKNRNTETKFKAQSNPAFSQTIEE